MTDIKLENDYDFKILNTLNKYGKMKEYFEKHHFYLMQGSKVVRELGNNKFRIMDKKDFLNGYSFTYWKHSRKVVCGKNKDETNKFRTYTTTGKFTTKWLNDEDRRTFGSFTFGPHGSNKCITLKNDYNTYNGFPCENIDEKVDMKVIKPILDLIRSLSGEDKTDEIFKYIVTWLAQMIQYPENIPMVSILISGGEGSGKGTFWRFISKIVGDAYCGSSDSIDSIFTSGSEHNTFFDGKIWVNIDEIGTSSRKYRNALYTIISEPKIYVKKIYEAHHYVDNYVRLFASTNKLNSVPTGGDEGRRWVLIRLDSNNLETRKKLAIDFNINHMGDKKLKEHFYKYLKEYKLEDDPVKWLIKNRPITKYQEDCQLSDISTINRFFVDYYGSICDIYEEYETLEGVHIDISNKILCEKYNEFGSNLFKSWSKITPRMFKRLINEMKWIKCNKKKIGMVCNIKVSEFKKFAIKNGF
jgi:hypothetical protein